MKRFISAVLLLAMLLSLAACGNASEPETVPVQTTEAAPVTEAAVETTVPTVPVETEAPTTVATESSLYDGFLFLSVSKITFSLVGESENIYLGSVPAELVTWESSDESVVTVENGLLTATGVGSATITCTYGDQTMSCEVGCLAADQESLNALGSDVLRTPKRLPPNYDDAEVTYFDDAAISGDSITYIMFQWENKHDLLGDPLFLVRGGISINGLVRKYKLLYYQGVESTLENAVAQAGVNKVFIMLGQNDLSYMSIEDTMANWAILVERLREKSPDLEIYIESCIPEWRDNGEDNSKNEKIAECNRQLEAFCAENDIHFWNIWPYAVDHEDKMPTIYMSPDGSNIHMNEDGCYSWMQALRAYAILEELREEYGV